MAKLKSGTRIYGTATIDTSVVVGSAVTLSSSGIQVTGIVTATTFVGALTGTASSTTNIPNLTGAITSNNTTTSLGSFSSANLAAALTDETGSGVAVFATSPTLVTPVLGAATATSIVVGSGVTINASGINAAAGIVTATTFVGALTGTASSTTNIPNLTGAITSNNTTTSLGSFTSAQLATALTDETGSGVAVFATSPTLVTPVLGAATATSIVVGSGVTINASGINAAAGIVTASQLSTGVSGTGININTDTISGPATLTIDPAAVGDNTGAVRIKGDLYVDGTQFIVNSTTIELADFNVGIATTVGTNALLDGAGIGIGSTSIRKTLTWSNSSTALKSSEDFDVASGKVYRVNGTSVLSNNTLASGVVNSSLTSVGTLGQLNVSGISTFTNGPVLIGGGTSTGTAGQVLQVAGINSSVYIGGNLGVGNTNPTEKLDIIGNYVKVKNNADASGGLVLDTGSTASQITQILLRDRNTDKWTIRKKSDNNFDIYDNNAASAALTILTGGTTLIGSATSTGTASQPLQVSGGAYVSTRLGVGVTNPASNTQVAIAGTLGISEVGGAGTRTLLSSSTSGFTLNHNDNSQITFQTLGVNRLTYSHSSNFWNIPSGTPLLVGTGTSTGTANQLLRVEGGAYVSSSVGIGTTNPLELLHVLGSTGAARFENTSNAYSVTISPQSSGPRVNFGSAGGSNFIEFGAFVNTNNLDTKGRDLKIYSTAVPSAFILRQDTGNIGIGTTNPTQTLHVQGNARVTGAVYDSTNSPGTSGQVLQSTVSGTQWTTAAAGGGSGKFDTTIDNVLYVQPTGTLDIVGVGTTTTQITTLPSGSTKYLVHSLHVTNISNGDAEITAGFVIDSRKVPASISVSVGSSGGPGIHTFTVGSASSITVGMAVTGTGNIGETTGIGSTAGFQFNTYVTSVDGNNITLSKPMSGRATGVLYFSPVSKVSSRLPVPVGSAVELLKQPMVLNALDSIVLQSTGAGSGIGSTSTAAITQAANSNILTVAAGAAITNFLASGMLIQPTGNNTGIQTNTFVGVGYTPGALTIPMTRPATVALASTSLSFTEVVVPQDGALQVTVVYQSSTDTAYLNGTGTVSASSTITSIPAGISSIPVAYYGTGNTYPSVIQSIRVSNISDGIIYPGGDYPVSVGIGNTDTIFSWLAYNMVIPKNSSIELCESPKRLGIGQSIFATTNTPYAIEIQIAGKQKTT